MIPQNKSLTPADISSDIDEFEAPLVALLTKDISSMSDVELKAYTDSIRALRADGTKRAAVVNKGAKATKARDKLASLDDLLG